MRLKPVRPAAFCGQAETVAKLRKRTPRGHVPAVMSESQGRQLIQNPDLLKTVPEILGISDCPVLVEGANGLEIITGYHKGSRVYAQGAMPEIMDLDSAVTLVHDLLNDFKFLTSADKSRAWAALLTPALLAGGILEGRAPMFVIEGDTPGAGKGMLANINAAIYNGKFANITRKKGGVGSFDESIGSALDSGNSFILFDNFKGNLNSQFLESLLTEKYVQVRLPYRGSINIDVSRKLFILTSNGVSMTADLARRIEPIQLEKQPEGYQFVHDDIIRHVKQNQPRYLGAVFAIIKYWHDQGSGRSKISFPSFTPWVQIVDYITSDILFMPSVMAGVKSKIERMANPALSWLREVGHHVIKKSLFGEMSATGICAEIDGVMPVPGLTGDEELNSETMTKAATATGMLLKKAFRDSDVVQIDGMQVERIKRWSATHNELKNYRFTRTCDPAGGMCLDF